MSRQAGDLTLLINEVKELKMQPVFSELSPEAVIAAVESYGFDVDGRLYALNSYENRVYQLGYEGGWWVVKFYRPDRWSDAAILEEHHFTQELSAADLPVAVPIERDGTTLFTTESARDHSHASYRFAIFPFVAAQSVDIEAPGALEFLGRSIGRLHAVGTRRRFTERPSLNVDRLGWQARSAVLESAVFSKVVGDPALEPKYAEVSAALLERVEHAVDGFGPIARIRIHGDCHLGNLLARPEGPVFVDFDDCMMGPRIQDLWMLLSGSSDMRERQWSQIVAGYEQFHHLDAAEQILIEPLRALRMVHHAGWVAARWEDPAFPKAFPWFTSARYWQDYISDLWQQREVC
jgi:Ser/Thr protein kinase RdoA (MazF antagonist)